MSPKYCKLLWYQSSRLVKATLGAFISVLMMIICPDKDVPKKKKFLQNTHTIICLMRPCKSHPSLTHNPHF